MLTVFFSTLLVTSAVWWLYKSRKPASLPPGPTSLPVFGGILSIGGGDIRDAFRHMAQKYGDIFTLDLGSQRTIVLASYASIREALVTKATAFSGRPVTSFTKDAGLEKGNLTNLLRSYIQRMRQLFVFFYILFLKPDMKCDCSPSTTL